MYLRKFNYIFGKTIMSIMLIIILWSSCVPVEEKQYELQKSLQDSTVASIVTFQNEQATDSILPYFSHPDPTYRYYAARAFQSYTDITAKDSLIKLLEDVNPEVRTAAAYALGQFRQEINATPLIEHFESNDSIAKYSYFNHTILEAVGKVGEEEELKLLTSIKTYRPTDTLLLTGQMRGLLHFQLRGMTSPEMDSLVTKITFSSLYPPQVKILAAEILNRSEKSSVDSKIFTIKRLWKDTDNTELKIAYLKIMDKLDGADVREFLRTIIFTSGETELQVAAFQAMLSSDFELIKPVVDSLVYADEPQLQALAVNALLENGSEDKISEYEKLIEELENPFAKAKIYKVIFRELPFYYAVTKKTLTNSIVEKINSTENPYLKAAYFSAVSEDVSNYKILIENGLVDENAIVRTTSVKGLLSILQSENLEKQFRKRASEVSDEIYEALKSSVIANADDGGLFQVLQASEEIEFDRLKSAIKEARNNLELPESWEVYTLISEKLDLKTISSEQFIREVNPSDILSLPDTVNISISTEKGEIKLELFPEKTPVTVLQIMELIENDYYNDKYIHRVVPQFVIQDGCPRGDGYGGLDYMLRTETPQLYYEDGGMLGMASAGRDTESSQWFITYCATPHLNGRYTLFGKVTEGMDVVQSIAEGDLIKSIKLL